MSMFGFTAPPDDADTWGTPAQSPKSPSIRIGYPGPRYSGTKKRGISRRATETSGIRYSFHPALRIIPRTPEEWNPAGRTPLNPFVRPFVRPRPFVIPFVRPRPFVSPFVRPTPLVKPLVRPRPFVRPFVRPRRPFVRPFSPFVMPVRRPAPRPRASPFVIPFFVEGVSEGRGSGFGPGLAGAFGGVASSSWTISWIAAWPRSSSSSSRVRAGANRTPQFPHVVAPGATGASHIGHGTVGPAGRSVSVSSFAARTRLSFARSV